MRNAVKMAFELSTRSEFTKVDCEIGMSVEGKELPTAGVLGAALEDAKALIQKRVTESYQTVPVRT